MENVALLTNPETGDIYEYLGKEGEKFKFRNLTAGKEGEVTKELASKSLKLSVHLNVLANENHTLLELIRDLNLGVLTNT